MSNHGLTLREEAAQGEQPDLKPEDLRTSNLERFEDSLTFGGPA
ncbi:MAG: hypothetical protein AB1896_16800 [Thermodesulfobacteriota bacterium]